MTQTRQPPLKGRLLDSITMRSCELCIADRMMESCFVAFHEKRPKKHLNKLMMAHVNPINLDLSSRIGFVDLATIGQR